MPLPQAIFPYRGTHLRLPRAVSPSRVTYLPLPRRFPFRGNLSAVTASYFPITGSFFAAAANILPLTGSRLAAPAGIFHLDKRPLTVVISSIASVEGPSSAIKCCIAKVRARTMIAPGEVFYPTVPSSETLSSFWASTANSMGSFWSTSLA